MAYGKENPIVDEYLASVTQWKEEFVETLTPGRQRAYILYFSKAKQSKTRESRIEKYMQQILDGKVLND